MRREREPERRAALKWSAGAAALAGAALLTPSGFAPQWFAPGSEAATRPVRAMRSDGAHTTFVVGDPEGDVLYFDSHPMSGCHPIAQQYMRLMAHFPLLVHERPRSALLICFGVGSTASAIAAHRSIERLDVVDLNDQVFATAPEFAATNGGVTADARVRLVHDDGRRFLAASTELYDLITSEPPPPMFAGVARLYSVEYYRDARAHLAPGGLMTQWLPADQMPRRVLDAAVRSFVEVFEQSLLFVGADTNFVLMGCNGELRLANLEARLAAEPGAAADLAPYRIRRPLDLAARIVRSGPELARDAASAELVSDQRNLLSLAFHDPADPPLVRFDPPALLAGLEGAGARELACRAEWERLLARPGLLKSAVPDFPESALQSAGDASGVDWHAAKARVAEAGRAVAAGRPEDAVAALEQVVRDAPDHLGARRWLGELLLRAGRHEAALAAWQAVQELEPADSSGPLGAAFALAQLGRRAQALALLEDALRRLPGEAALHKLHGDLLAADARRAEALAAYDRALALQPGDRATLEARQRAAGTGR